jgi:hypothetical protein
MIQIKIEVSKLDKSFLERYSVAVDKASVRAANRTMSSVRTRVQRYLSDKLGVARKDIIKRLFIRSAAALNREASLSFLGKGIPMISLGARVKTVKTARGKRKGVTALVGGSRQLIPGAFIATMKSGKAGVFQRKGDGRLPIRELFSMGAYDILKTDTGFVSDLQSFAQDTMEKNFRADYEFFSGK